LNSSGNKTSKLLLVLLTEVCLAASGSYGTENSTSNSAPKPASHPVVNSAKPMTTHSAGNKAGAPSKASHSANTRGGNPHSGSAHYPARTHAAHGSTASTAKRTTNRTVAYASPRKGPTARNRHSRPSPPRTLTGQQRLARVHLEPERVDEIQQALIREGYFEGDTTGQWDSRTREAMLRYQTMHGFPATGLPEAKSLMKLGLGSHPLPPELDHGSVGIASPRAVTQSVFSVSPSAPPISQAEPPTLDATPPTPVH